MQFARPPTEVAYACSYIPAAIMPPGDPDHVDTPITRKCWGSKHEDTTTTTTQARLSRTRLPKRSWCDSSAIAPNTQQQHHHHPFPITKQCQHTSATARADARKEIPISPAPESQKLHLHPVPNKPSVREPPDVDCTLKRRQHARTAVLMPFLEPVPQSSLSRRSRNTYTLSVSPTKTFFSKTASVSIAPSTACLRVSPVDGCREETGRDTDSVCGKFSCFFGFSK